MCAASISNANQNLIRILIDLKNKSEENRLKAAKQLTEFLNEISKEYTNYGTEKVIRDIYHSLYESLKSSDQYERFGAIQGLDEIAKNNIDSSSDKKAKIQNCLRIALPNNDTELMKMAAGVLGKLVLENDVNTSKLIDFEVKRCFEWLQSDQNELRRHASVLILNVLIKNAPTLTYSYFSELFNLIWIPINDNKAIIRVASADILRSSLKLMLQRESLLHDLWYSRAWNEAIKGLNSNSLDHIHGSFLIFRELITNSGQYINSKFLELCTIYLKYKDHKDPSIRKIIIQSIPSLAHYNPEIFVSMYLDKFATYLISQFRNEPEKYIAFLAIGQISKSIEFKINPYIPDIVASIKENLVHKNKMKSGSQILECISLLAISVAPTLSKYANELLDLIFQLEFSEPLVQCLADLSTNLPSVLPTVQNRLLNMISVVLRGRDFIPCGSPLKKTIREINSKQLINLELNNADSVVLSLKTLGTFNFFGHSLSGFIRECVIHYLEDSRLVVRHATALTCCKMLSKDPICHQKSSNSIRTINNMLIKVLMTGVADPDAGIRHTIISNLDSNFDDHLAQTDNFFTLSLGMNDEYFPIREATFQIISRITLINPAIALPLLRKELVKCLSELEYSNQKLNQDNSRMIRLIISSSSTLILPYVEPIIDALLSKSKDPDPITTANTLRTIGELTKIGGKELEPYYEQIVLLLIENLQDKSSSIKRSAALSSFCQFSRCTGYVIQPYTDYPDLMPILVDILKNEQNLEIRQETMKLIGILGAISPYLLKSTLLGSDEASFGPKIASNNTDLNIILTGIGPSAEESYPTIVISSLLKILKDPTLSLYYQSAINSFMNIFNTLGLEIVSFLPLILPSFFNVIRACPFDSNQFYFKQLSNLVLIVKQHIRTFLPEIFKLIQDFWNTSSETQITLVTLIESISTVLGGEFNQYIPLFLPQVLQVLDSEASESHKIIKQILQTIVSFGSSIHEYSNLVVPSVIKLLEKPEILHSNKKAAIETIGMLFSKLQCSEFTSQAIHSISRVLYINNDDLRNTSMKSLYLIAYHIRRGYVAFIPLVKNTMQSNQIKDFKYDELIQKIILNQTIQNSSLELLGENPSSSGLNETPLIELGSNKKLSVSETLLKRAWETLQRSTKEDWFEWFKKLKLELLRQSPSHALRACAMLASEYSPLARELFNAAFYSCWSELGSRSKDELVRSLEIALASPTIPNDILNQLLSLAEFMEKDHEPLPIDIGTLGMHASRCHSYANALRYKEIEFISNPSPKVIEDLIFINSQLQHPDAAVGILTYTQRHHQIELEETWYEKLGRWDDALKAYNRKQGDSDGGNNILGRMRCLYNLGEFHQLARLVEEKWDSFLSTEKEEIAPYATSAIWSSGELKSLNKYTKFIKPENPDYSFYHAVLSLYHCQYDQAQTHINHTRNLLDSELTAIISESYSRAYPIIVQIQMLSELEEVIQYKLFSNETLHQSVIHKTWIKRLKGCQPDVNVWHRALSTRSFVLSSSDDLELWVEFTSLCRKNGRLSLSENTLNMLLQDIKSKKGSHDSHQHYGNEWSVNEVIFESFKHSWATGAQQEALDNLSYFTERLASNLNFSNFGDTHTYSYKSETQKLSQNGSEKSFKLLASCFLKQAEWQASLRKGWNEATTKSILYSYSLATTLDKHWYKAWNAYAIAHFEVVNHYRQMDSNVTQCVLTNYVVPAVNGFFKSINLSKGNSLQDTLRLLTLLFEYGTHSNIYATILEGFSSVSIVNWLQVIPQLIARINSPSPNIQKLVHKLLTEIGSEYPQALVYPIAVASKSHSSTRRNSALLIMKHLRWRNAELVEYAIVVSEELIRVAILWQEIWHEGLGDAYRLCFSEQNIEGMLSILEPLHQMIETEPVTLNEISFNASFGQNLHEAYQWCLSYKKSLDFNHLNKAWDIYRKVFQRLDLQLPNLTQLELQNVSPKLASIRNLNLAIPGSCRSLKNLVKIRMFSSALNVITSKQRPRKLVIKGSDGLCYQYLLKGHEDLRLDERVMQLFGLVNTLLETDSETFKRQLSIERYTVTPLSPNSGLIGWVPHTDTFHTLIRDYRNSRKILLNMELLLILKLAPELNEKTEFDKLPLMQKMEVFESVLDYTTGQDFNRALWIKSKNSEAWLARRTCYTRSLATMSIVGYILGLGDRHPSNLMLDQFSGKVIHIDFGDCFEVAMHRDHYPEHIPFRLTRMLVNAMGVCGIEGNYRTTCESVLRVLRSNKESLMAVLEAFVYDPLINWRLLTHRNPSPINNSTDMSPTVNSFSEHEFSQSYKQISGSPFTLEDRQEPEEHYRPEVLNRRAITVITRISSKLTGEDFDRNRVLDVPQQVDKLIHQATSIENLCQLFTGWCPFW